MIVGGGSIGPGVLGRCFRRFWERGKRFLETGNLIWSVMKMRDISKAIEEILRQEGIGRSPATVSASDLGPACRWSWR